jgi:hypothetical protein
MFLLPPIVRLTAPGAREDPVAVTAFKDVFWPLCREARGQSHYWKKMQKRELAKLARVLTVSEQSSEQGHAAKATGVTGVE